MFLCIMSFRISEVYRMGAHMIYMFLLINSDSQKMVGSSDTQQGRLIRLEGVR